MTLNQIDQEITKRIEKLECQKLNAWQRTKVTTQEILDIQEAINKEIWVLQNMQACIIIHK